MPRLQNKLALVTAAARGTGAAIAAALAQEGARVIVSDIDATLGPLTAQALGASWLRLDVREELAWVAAMAQVLDSHGRLDVLVNSSGSGDQAAPGHAHDPEHTSLHDWQAVLRRQLDGVFLGCKHGLGAMRRGGRGGAVRGSIINVLPRPALTAAGAASEAALRQHSKTVALYCAAQGLAVRCHSLRPTTGARRPEDLAALAVLLAGGATPPQAHDPEGPLS